MLTVRDAIPKARELATAEFATLRLRLLKIAARVVETTSRIRLAFAAACPEADLFRSLPGASVTDWACARSTRPISPTPTKQVDVEPGEKAGRSPMPAASPPSGIKNDRALVNRSG
jgi:Transposase DDE domain group 1